MESTSGSRFTNTILFVDDEENILKSLKREFHRSNFKVLLALGARNALKVMEQAKIDVVISDVRMPEMDGIEFLDTVREKFPYVSRVILSGYVEQTNVVKAITRGCATTYFSKPWDTEMMKDGIDQILKIREKLKASEVLETINQIDDLPSLPELYQEFVEAVAEEKPINDIATIINKDIGLSARLLQLANSAFYGTMNIDTVDQAMMRLGLDAIKDMVLAFTYIQKMNWTPSQINEIQGILHHSSQVNKQVRTLYEKKFNSVLPKKFASLGLIHDIGKLILLQYFPDRYQSIQDNQKKNPVMTFYESECDLGFKATHSEIGAYILSLWHLPDAYVEVCLFHHRPEEVSKRFKNVIDTLAFSDSLVDQIDLTGEEEEIDPSKLNPGFMEGDELADLVATIRSEMKEAVLPK